MKLAKVQQNPNYMTEAELAAIASDIRKLVVDKYVEKAVAARFQKLLDFFEIEDDPDVNEMIIEDVLLKLSNSFDLTTADIIINGDNIVPLKAFCVEYFMELSNRVSGVIRSYMKEGNENAK